MSAPKRVRLDAELVRRGLARSRTQAQELISAGRVIAGGAVATKAATQLETAAPLRVTDDPAGPAYASRGGHKLAGALTDFVARGLVVRGRRCLDAGASTGGFTDVLLRSGADHVVAVDVGYGQLIWSLQQDPRVTVLDRTNVRHLDAASVAPAPGLVVGDLSFISLTLLLGPLKSVAADDADLVLMVKPQFEVGRERLPAGGVVREAGLRREAVESVVRHAETLGLGLLGVSPSRLPGPRGNVEYFVWLRDLRAVTVVRASEPSTVDDRPGCSRSVEQAVFLVGRDREIAVAAAIDGSPHTSSELRESE